MSIKEFRESLSLDHPATIEQCRRAIEWDPHFNAMLMARKYNENLVLKGRLDAEQRPTWFQLLSAIVGLVLVILWVLHYVSAWGQSAWMVSAGLTIDGWVRRHRSQRVKRLLEAEMDRMLDYGAERCSRCGERRDDHPRWDTTYCVRQISGNE